ncbi:MAG: hypothetical protein WCF33_22125 [Pseudonocardiaceae bacterium]
MRLHWFLPCVIGFTLCAVACSATPAAQDPGPVFDNEGGRTVNCMVHQPASPGSRYTDPQRRDTVEVLTLLHYYTDNGSKPYCDGKPPSAVDRSWAQLYVELGANPTAVQRLLPARGR